VELEEVKKRLIEIEPLLAEQRQVELAAFERGERTLHLVLTDRLRRIARKHKVWRSTAMLTALKNARYGFSDERARSKGGSDGIFLLDRGFKPENAMMRRMFRGFLDKERSEAGEIASRLGVACSELRAVRLVSHQMRLLGVLARKPDADWLVLVDLDPSK
jgi:hypothetical protein